MSEPAPNLIETSTLEWVRQPQQARSQKTMERLLDAAEQLIEERGVEGMTISAIVAQAGSSVGAFYARFGDKDTLLRCMFERFYDQARATADSALDPERWQTVPLYDALRSTILFVATVFRERRGVIAALSTQFGSADAFSAPAQVLSNHISGKLLALADARGEVVTRPNPHAAVKTCVWLVLSALSSWANAGASSSAPPSNPDAFATDVADMTIGFLFAPRA